jgi:hypothetical protein
MSRSRYFFILNGDSILHLSENAKILLIFWLFRPAQSSGTHPASTISSMLDSSVQAERTEFACWLCR